MAESVSQYETDLVELLHFNQEQQQIKHQNIYLVLQGKAAFVSCCRANT